MISSARDGSAISRMTKPAITRASGRSKRKSAICSTNPASCARAASGAAAGGSSTRAPAVASCITLTMCSAQASRRPSLPPKW